ncbi:acyltransferase [Mucilaginibacter endophyticus]|uniref:acyltransferase n=1 Tax=Mucilaginibacter endophyticus TaxID=2675003 RepID=UPI000E0D9136|nr:acyltransferase [Mucilaginibacter endophyticus]
MKTLLKILFKLPVDYVKEVMLRLYNTMNLKAKKVEFGVMPQINGKLILLNNGRCKFGDHLKFNSSTRSNMVGLYKACTIYISKNANLTIGNSSGFSGVSIYCSNKIEIGDFVNCGGNVCIWDTDFHPLEYKARRIHDIDKINTRPIKIGNDAFIGANSIILKGVIIGERSIVGAGSVVTKSIPPDEIWAGNPAKFIRAIATTKSEVI